MDHSAPLRPAGSRRSIQPLTTCPEPRVKRAFPEGLPASPVFTRVSGRPIYKLSIYGRPRFAYPKTHYLPGFPACCRQTPD